MLPSILVVDDHEIVFQGLKLILSTSNFDAKISYCFNGDECLKLLRTQHFDLVILDINMPDTDTLNLMDIFHREFNGQKLLIFSTNPEVLYAKRFLQAGATGYLSKDESSELILVAIRQVLAGKKYMSNSLKEQFAIDIIHGAKDEIFETLSDREMEVAKYLILGKSNKEICNITN